MKEKYVKIYIQDEFNTDNYLELKEYLIMTSDDIIQIIRNYSDIRLHPKYIITINDKLCIFMEPFEN